MSVYEIETFAVGAFQCNCSIIINTEDKTAFVVDPGDEPFEILERLDHYGVRLAALWHTHAHIDHIGATKTLFEEGARRALENSHTVPTVFLHEGDRWLYENVAIQGQLLGMHGFDVTDQWTKIQDSQKYEGFTGLRALHTPGHTPGSCCLSVSHECSMSGSQSYGRGFSGLADRVVLTGDTLFRGSIGRTDLWGGDSATLLKSIKNKLMALDANADDCLVIPGHGPMTSLSAEKKSNPFLQNLR